MILILRIVLIGFLSAAAFSALAQTITTRAGEHGSFTRLVIRVEGLESWTLGRTADGYGLTWKAATDQPPDLSETFNKITRNRLRDLRYSATGSGLDKQLFIDLACDCHAKPFVFQKDYIVVDLYDGAAPAGSIHEVPISGHAQAEGATDALPRYDWLSGFAAAPFTATPPPPPQPPQNLAALPADETAAPEPETTAAPVPDVTAAPEPAPVEARPPNPLETAREMDGFRQSLIEGLASQASAGRVTLQPAPTAPPSVTLVTPAQDVSLPGLNLGTDGPLSAQGRACPAKSLVDLASWSDALGEDGYMRMAQSRARLLDEFDAPLPDAVLDAAKSHLALGFGSEARLLLRTMAEDGAETDVLTALGYIVDGEIPPDNPFADFHSCPSDAALWSLLAAPEGEVLRDLDADAVALTFLGLPPHLRLFLAPEVSERLLQNGAAASAAMVRDATGRAESGEPKLTPVLDAKLELAAGDAVAAERALGQSPTPENAPQPIAAALTEPKALATLAEARFAQNSPMAPEDVLSLEAFHFSEGGGEDGPALTRALALARAVDGRLDAAMALAAEDAPTRADLWDYAANSAADGALLGVAGAVTPEAIAQIAPATRTGIAKRLIDLGLPEMANDWLPDPENQADLMAAIHLAEGDGLSALVEINRSAAPDDLRNALRADAYLRLRDYPKAAELLSGAGKRAEAERVQRWGQTWDAATSEVDDLWRQIGLDVGPIATPDAPSSIFLGKDLMSRSAATRQKVEALLAETSLQQEALPDSAAQSPAISATAQGDPP